MRRAAGANGLRHKEMRDVGDESAPVIGGVSAQVGDG
jgi:hypothetical protein